MLLNELKKMGKVVIDASTETIVVKFILPTAKTNKQPQLNKSWSISPIRAKEKPVEITQADKTLATLKRTEKLVVEEIAKFEEEIKTLEQTARTKIKEGSKTGVSCFLNVLQYFHNQFIWICRQGQRFTDENNCKLL